jgi:hypothetical protein
MILDLKDEEPAALARLLSATIDGDRFPLSPRIQTLKGISRKDPTGDRCESRYRRRRSITSRPAPQQADAGVPRAI